MNFGSHAKLVILLLVIEHCHSIDIFTKSLGGVSAEVLDIATSDSAEKPAVTTTSLGQPEGIRFNRDNTSKKRETLKCIENF